MSGRVKSFSGTERTNSSSLYLGKHQLKHEFKGHIDVWQQYQCPRPEASSWCPRWPWPLWSAAAYRWPLWSSDTPNDWPADTINKINGTLVGFSCVLWISWQYRVCLTYCCQIENRHEKVLIFWLKQKLCETKSKPDLDNHLDCGQSGGDVLRVRRSHRDGDTAGVQAAIEGGDQVDSCRANKHEQSQRRAHDVSRKRPNMEISDLHLENPNFSNSNVLPVFEHKMFKLAVNAYMLVVWLYMCFKLHKLGKKAELKCFSIFNFLKNPQNKIYTFQDSRNPQYCAKVLTQPSLFFKL